MADYYNIKDIISVSNILADKMDKSGKVAIQQVVDAIKDLPTADVVEIPNGMTRAEVEHRLNAKVCNDYVERSEYDKLNKDLEYEHTKGMELANNLIDVLGKLDFQQKQYKELREKIDNAIEEVKKEKEWLLSIECSGYNIGIAFNSIIHTLKKLGE